MILIGEKLNSSIPKTNEAMINRDECYIIDMIKAQEARGARYIDINTATAGDEAELMRWIIGLVREHSSCGIMIDSCNISVIEQALDDTSGTDVIVNSITATKRLHELAGIIKEKNASVVCLPMGNDGVPRDSDSVLSFARLIVENLASYNIKEDRIYIDTLVSALSVGSDSAAFALENIKRLKSELTGTNTICGISNISFGLPGRRILNSVFLSCAMYCGLDSAILDVTSESIRDCLYASKAILGSDEYCMDFIGYMRSK